jgi:hypothetical protein
MANRELIAVIRVDVTNLQIHQHTSTTASSRWKPGGDPMPHNIRRCYLEPMSSSDETNSKRTF